MLKSLNPTLRPLTGQAGAFTQLGGRSVSQVMFLSVSYISEQPLFSEPISSDLRNTTADRNVWACKGGQGQRRDLG